MNHMRFLHQKLWGIRLFEYLSVLGFYFLAAVLYHITLRINISHLDPDNLKIFDVSIFFRQAGLGYSIKLLVTLPFWWFFFRKMRGVALRYRLLLHFATLPLFCLIYQKVFYETTEFLGFWHLEGSGSVWDVYIPALFYFIQFGIFHAYEYYQTSQRDLKVKAELSEAALKSELAALKAQLNPHFLYNVFNAISASLPPEQEQTREMIANLSTLLRYQLKATREEWVSLREELDFVTKYLELEKVRFEDRLQVVMDVAEEVKDTPVPPMILQPLIENSIKHGIASLIEGGEIAIRIHQVGGKIAFEVSDTGVGMADKSQLFDVGIGLTNTKLRLEKIYDSELVISDNFPRGLKIQFVI